MEQFINSRDRLVVEALDGGLRAGGDAKLARLDGFPSIKVILDTGHNPARVAVISGGGSGHEPAHAGFVGKGMLTAAVCGEVFASPSVDAVLAAILAVTGKGGCVLIVKNYTGDRLNFGLAAERARALGKRVEMVIVADDIALPHLAQRRGVAGTLFIHKIAGYHAAKGDSLEKVAEIARRAANSVVSLGISLGSCTVPGAARDDRVPAGKAELGLGIHGEPGAELIDFEGARQTSSIHADMLFAAAAPARGYALLLNNLGGCTGLEMGVIANEFLSAPSAKKIKLLVGPAALMTSLDMHGFSASLLPLTPGIEKALNAPVGPKAWPGISAPVKPAIRKLPKEMRPRRVTASKNAVLRTIVDAACDALIAAESGLNTLDSKIGDGDTGTTMASAAKSVKSAVPGMPLAKLDLFFGAVSDCLTKTMGGSSGVLLAIFFAAAGTAASSGESWSNALQSGLRKMKEYGGASPGDRTMIDALEPALAALAGGSTVVEAAAAARKGANATAKMQSARAGRASYVSSSHLDGVADPGAEAVALLFEALSGSARQF